MFKVLNQEKEMATYSSTLAWRISSTEEPGRLQSRGSQRVGHDWSNLANHKSVDLKKERWLKWAWPNYVSPLFPALGYRKGHLKCSLSDLKESDSEVTQLCLTLSDPRDYSLPGSSVHGIFQARVLEWVAIAFSASIIWILSNIISENGLLFE